MKFISKIINRYSKSCCDDFNQSCDILVKKLHRCRSKKDINKVLDETVV